MQKIKIDKVFFTAGNEPVRHLRYDASKPVKKSMLAPDQIIKGKFLYTEMDLVHDNGNNTPIYNQYWLECTWNLDGSERVRLSEVENHSLVEMEPRKGMQNVQLTMF